MLRTITTRASRSLARVKINRIYTATFCINHSWNTAGATASNERRARYSSDTGVTTDNRTYSQISNETLESLCEYFEEIIEQAAHLKGTDVIYGDGVLTVKFGSPYGTYVINRQSPNKQIWLSSPTSGPKRYDLVPDHGGYWVYKHDGVTLHQLLQKEIPSIVKIQVDFGKCAHSLIK